MARAPVLGPAPVPERVQVQAPVGERVQAPVGEVAGELEYSVLVWVLVPEPESERVMGWKWWWEPRRC